VALVREHLVPASPNVNGLVGVEVAEILARAPLVGPNPLIWIPILSEEPLDGLLVGRQTLLAAVTALPRAEDVAAPASDEPPPAADAVGVSHRRAHLI
jgi:hypothetical protein